MRTTLNLDEGLLDRARDLADKSKKPFRLVVNEALRLGLSRLPKKSLKSTYQTKPHKMGLRPEYSLDNIQELIAAVEGASSR